MFAGLYLCQLLLISQVGRPTVTMPVDCTGRPDMIALKQAAASPKTSAKPYREKTRAGASRGSAYATRTSAPVTTAKYSYTTPQINLPPTAKFSEKYYEEQSFRKWNGPAPDDLKSLSSYMPVAPTAQFPVGKQENRLIGAMAASIGNMNSNVEKPFADFAPNASLAAATRAGGMSYTESGRQTLRNQERHRLIDLSTGQVLSEWQCGSETNSLYNRSGQGTWSSHNYFMNHTPYFQNNGRK